jgi:ABC-2 type transport system permease protein
MGLWLHELRLFIRQRVAWPAVLLLALLSAASVVNGLGEVAEQRAAIARIQPLQAEDEAAIADFVTRDGDPGSAAYYTFHATWDEPSNLAFAALGQRDVAPYLLRVNALALESQIHANERYNPELALPGKFDWAFVLVFVAPLVLVVLLHDVWSAEREAGRMALLRSLAASPANLWGRRIAVRFSLAWAALVVPFAIGALVAGTPLAGLATSAGVALAYLAFWALVAWLVGRLGWSSAANAAGLAAAWFVLVLVLPALAHLAINAAIPVRQGVELTLDQREAVHAGWDKPKDETMAAFGQLYPEWRDTPPVEGGFHYKWYYAFQHLGDVSVADEVAAYRQALLARDRWTRIVGYILPPVAVQVALHCEARTDLMAQLDYQDRVRAFHEQVRRFYYPYVFNDALFTRADFAKAPRWNQASGAGAQQ